MRWPQDGPCRESAPTSAGSVLEDQAVMGAERATFLEGTDIATISADTTHVDFAANLVITDEASAALAVIVAGTSGDVGGTHAA